MAYWYGAGMRRMLPMRWILRPAVLLAVVFYLLALLLRAALGEGRSVESAQRGNG